MICQNNRSHEQPHQRQKALGKLTPNPKATLQEQVHEVMRFFHYSPRTEETYWQWIRQFLAWARGAGVSREGAPGDGDWGSEISEGTGGWRHPRTMGLAEVQAFLAHLATVKDVAVATQNQALNALVFLYLLTQR